jgi:hypothetical protein
MSEKTYTLLSWKGEQQGMHSASEIKRMWESEEISGLYQVVTDSGNLSVQDFISFEQEQSERERQQELAQAQSQAEAERLSLEMQRIEAETAQRLEVERMKIEQEQAEQVRLEEQMSGKIYYIYMDGQKKGPYSKENLQVMHRGGKIDETTRVWTKDLGEWVDLKGFQEIVGGTATPQYPGPGSKQYPPQYGSPQPQARPVRQMNVQHRSNVAQIAPPVAPTPVALITWGWLLFLPAPLLIGFIFGAIAGAAGISMSTIYDIGMLIGAVCQIACLIISIVLICKPSTTGKVNGIIILVLLVLAIFISVLSKI